MAMPSIVNHQHVERLLGKGLVSAVEDLILQVNPWRFENEKTEELYRLYVLQNAAGEARFWISLGQPLYIISRGMGLGWLLFGAPSREPGKVLMESMALILSISILLLLRLSSRWEDQGAAGKLALHLYRAFNVTTSCLVYIHSVPVGQPNADPSCVGLEKFAFLVVYNAGIGSMIEYSFGEKIASLSLLIMFRMAALVKRWPLPADEMATPVMFLLSLSLLYFRYALVRRRFLKNQATETFNVIFERQLSAPVMDLFSQGSDEYYTTTQWKEIQEETQAMRADISHRGARHIAKGRLSCYNVSRHLLGQGSGGGIFAAEANGSKQKVAVKRCDLVSKRSKAESDLLNEIAILSVIRHPNIILGIDAALSNGCVCLILELCDGGSLAMHLRKGKLSLEDARHSTSQLMNAVKYLHQLGMVHHDIKPSNILFRHGMVRLADFGIAMWLHSISAGTASSSVRGSNLYLAPEVVMRDDLCGRKIDVWSVGCCVVEMLSLQAVGESFYGEVVLELLVGEANPNWYSNKVTLPDMPEVAAQFAKRCLVPNPRHRPNSLELLQHEFILGYGLNPVSLEIAQDPVATTSQTGMWTVSCSVLQAIWDVQCRLDGCFADSDMEREFMMQYLPPRQKVAMTSLQIFHFMLLPPTVLFDIVPTLTSDPVKAAGLSAFLVFATIWLFLLHPALTPMTRCYIDRVLCIFVPFVELTRTGTRLLSDLIYVVGTVITHPLNGSAWWSICGCLVYLLFRFADIAIEGLRISHAGGSLSEMELTLINALVLVLVLFANATNQRVTMEMERTKFLTRKRRGTSKSSAPSTQEDSHSTATIRSAAPSEGPSSEPGTQGSGDCSPRLGRSQSNGPPLEWKQSWPGSSGRLKFE